MWCFKRKEKKACVFFFFFKKACYMHWSERIHYFNTRHLDNTSTWLKPWQNVASVHKGCIWDACLTVTLGVNRILTSKGKIMIKRSAALSTKSNANLQISKLFWDSCDSRLFLIFNKRLKYGKTHEFQPIHLVLEISWDMCCSSGAYKRSDSAISHSLSIPFKVSLDLLFTDSHLHCQGASRDLNQVLCGPEQGNIFTRVHVLELVHPVGLHCVCMKASKKTTACVFVKKTSRRVHQERCRTGSRFTRLSQGGKVKWQWPCWSQDDHKYNILSWHTGCLTLYLILS